MPRRKYFVLSLIFYITHSFCLKLRKLPTKIETFGRGFWVGGQLITLRQTFLPTFLPNPPF
jgi:hypothetical protein